MSAVAPQLEDIQVEDLSPRLRELVNVVGFGPAIKLVRTRGGTRIDIPHNAKPGSALVRLVGVETAEKLIAHYGAGTFIDIDRGVGALRAARDRNFFRDAVHLSGAQLALRYEMTARHVWRKLAKHPIINDRQTTLL